jgi:hypothetical protein
LRLCEGSVSELRPPCGMVAEVQSAFYDMGAAPWAGKSSPRE